jgi:hypothetical protein
LLAGDQADAGYLAGQGAVFGRFSLWLPVGWWFGWRAGWIIVLGGLWAGWRTAAIQPRMLLAAGLVGLLVIYFLAWDSSRSIAVALPWAVYGAGQSWMPRRVLWGTVALNYLLPAALLSATFSAQQGIVPTLMPLP